MWLHVLEMSYTWYALTDAKCKKVMCSNGTFSMQKKHWGMYFCFVE